MNKTENAINCFGVNNRIDWETRTPGFNYYQLLNFAEKSSAYPEVAKRYKAIVEGLNCVNGVSERFVLTPEARGMLKITSTWTDLWMELAISGSNLLIHINDNSGYLGSYCIDLRVTDVEHAFSAIMDVWGICKAIKNQESGETTRDVYITVRGVSHDEY